MHNNNYYLFDHHLLFNFKQFFSLSSIVSRIWRPHNTCNKIQEIHSLSLCIIQAQSVSILTSWCHHTLPTILHCTVHYDMATMYSRALTTCTLSHCHTQRTLTIPPTDVTALFSTAHVFVTVHCHTQRTSTDTQ